MKFKTVVIFLQSVIHSVMLLEMWDLNNETKNGTFYEQHHFFVAAYFAPETDKNLNCGYVSLKIQDYFKNELIIELPTEIITRGIMPCQPHLHATMCFFYFKDISWMLIISTRYKYIYILVKQESRMDERESRIKLKEFLDNLEDYKEIFSLKDFTFANGSCQRVAFLWIVIVLVILAVVALILILFGGKMQERLNSSRE